MGLGVFPETEGHNRAIDSPTSSALQSPTQAAHFHPTPAEIDQKLIETEYHRSFPLAREPRTLQRSALVLFNFQMYYCLPTSTSLQFWTFISPNGTNGWKVIQLNRFLPSCNGCLKDGCMCFLLPPDQLNEMLFQHCCTDNIPDSAHELLPTQVSLL